MSTEDIPNFSRVDERVITGGQPTEGQIRSAAEDGVQVVINLATIDPRYSLDDEGGLVQSLGMEYHHIPVVWDNPTDKDYEDFVTVMDQTGDKRLLVHCAANYRASAFYSLYAMQRLGWTAAQAAEFRAPLWRRKYPIWDAFIWRMQERIAAGKA